MSETTKDAVSHDQNRCDKCGWDKAQCQCFSLYEKEVAKVLMGVRYLADDRRGSRDQKYKGLMEIQRAVTDMLDRVAREPR